MVAGATGTRHSHRPSSGSRVTAELLAAAPLLSLVEHYERLSQTLRTEDPKDRSARLFARFAERLAEVIEQASDLDVVVTVPTAAQALKVSEQRVRQLCASGNELEARKVGGDWRILRDSLERLLLRRPQDSL